MKIKITLFLLLLASLTFGQVMVSTLTDEIPASGGVKIDSHGNVYIANFGQGLSNANGNQIWKLDKEGNLEVFATGFQGASGNDFDSQGNLFQSSIAGSFISKVTPEGEVSTFVSSGINGPVGIGIDSADNLYVCNCGNNTIRKVTPDGTSTLFASGAIFSCPNGIALDHEENIYISNFSNANIVKITPEGATSIFASIPGNNNGHLAYSAIDSVFYVNSHGSHRVYRMTLEGDLEVVAGSGIRGNVDGLADQAQFSRPNGIDVTPSGDTLYLNSSIPTTDVNFPLNPSLVRMVTGLRPDSVSSVKPVWEYEGLEMSHFPNPASGKVTITYELPKDLDVELRLYDVGGQLLRNVDLGRRVAGRHQLEFSTEELAKGLYYYSLVNEGFVLSRVLVVGD